MPRPKKQTEGSEAVQKVQKFKVKIALLEPMLGTVAMDPETYQTYLQDEAIKNGLIVADELETLPEETDDNKGVTGFHKLEDGTPIIYNYLIKGFFKEAAGTLKKAGWEQSKDFTAFKKGVDGAVFVFPRRIPIKMPEGGKITINERPLRAQTQQGERVALARSEQVPADSELEFEIHILGDQIVNERMLKEWLDYGMYRGLGQWRSAGWGAYETILFERLT